MTRLLQLRNRRRHHQPSVAPTLMMPAHEKSGLSNLTVQRYSIVKEQRIAFLTEAVVVMGFRDWSLTSLSKQSFLRRQLWATSGSGTCRGGSYASTSKRAIDHEFDATMALMATGRTMFASAAACRRKRPAEAYCSNV